MGIAEEEEEVVVEVGWMERGLSWWGEAVVSCGEGAVVVVVEAECVSASQARRCYYVGRMGEVHDLRERTVGRDWAPRGACVCLKMM